MINQELLSVLDQLQREKGISQETLLEALQSAILTATKKRFGGGDNFQVEIDPKTGEIQILHVRRIVENVLSPMEEISLEEAMESDPGAEVGDEIGSFLDIDDFGRIAAQAAKQVIFQKVREAEWSVVAKEFGGKKGNVVTGVYIGQEKRNFIIDLGKTEAILPFKEQIPRESFHRGDRVKALLLDIRTTTRGPQLILSRTHPDFLARLFEKEVPEISEGIIEIKGVVRDPGERAKVAVLSRDPNVDPVGSCVGVKGSRVQAIVREIHGEKIDIIDWSPDPGTFIARALSPAKVLRVATRDGEFDKVATVVVANQQLSLAIGRRGQNVRLAAKLTGWKIDIFSEQQYEADRMARSAEEQHEALSEQPVEQQPSLIMLEDLPGMGGNMADALKAAGFDSVEKVANASAEDIAKLPKFGPKTAAKLIETARDFLGYPKSATTTPETDSGSV